MRQIHQQIHQALGIDAPQKLDSPLYDDDDEEDKHLLTQQYATNVVENGFVDVSLERAFLPTSAQDLRQTVDRFRNINERLERQYIMGFADTSCESSGETESTSRMNDTIGAHAERLYQLLAKESNTSTEHKHEVLIQLSGFNESSVRKVTAFEMLLSTCPTSREMPTKLDWQDTLCTLEM